MKLVNTTYDLTIELEEETVQVLIIENPKILSAMLQELHQQIYGGDGNYVLSNNDKIIKIAKKTSLILEPLSITCGDKKIISKIYDELSMCVEDQLLEDKVKINQEVISYIDNVIRQVPYPLEYNLEIETESLLKLVGVRMEVNETDLCEKVAEYIKVMSAVCKCELIIFLNLKMYFTKEELELLYKQAIYSNIKLILIENLEREQLSGEKIQILDYDKCWISLT